MIFLTTTNDRRGQLVTREFDTEDEAISLAKELAEDEDVHVEVYRLDDLARPWQAVTLFEANSEAIA